MDRHADFMCIKIAGFQEAHFIGGDHGNAVGNGQLDGSMNPGLFILASGADQLKIVALREVLLIERQALGNLGMVTAQQHLANVATTPAGKQDQPFAQLDQPVTIDDRTGGTITTLVCF